MIDITKLIEKKRTGDIVIVAQMIGETPDYTKKLLKRTGAKKHLLAFEALAKIIAARENILSEYQTL